MHYSMIQSSVDLGARAVSAHFLVLQSEAGHYKPRVRIYVFDFFFNMFDSEQYVMYARTYTVY